MASIISMSETVVESARHPFLCPYPGCKRKFSSLWRLKVHYRAPPTERGSGKERGHGVELPNCPACGDELQPGKHHNRCKAGRTSHPSGASRQRCATASGRSQATKQTSAETATAQRQPTRGPDRIHIESITGMESRWDEETMAAPAVSARPRCQSSVPPARPNSHAPDTVPRGKAPSPRKAPVDANFQGVPHFDDEKRYSPLLARSRRRSPGPLPDDRDRSVRLPDLRSQEAALLRGMSDTVLSARGAAEVLFTLARLESGKAAGGGERGGGGIGGSGGGRGPSGSSGGSEKNGSSRGGGSVCSVGDGESGGGTEAALLPGGSAAPDSGETAAASLAPREGAAPASTLTNAIPAGVPVVPPMATASAPHPRVCTCGAAAEIAAADTSGVPVEAVVAGMLRYGWNKGGFQGRSTASSTAALPTPHPSQIPNGYVPVYPQAGDLPLLLPAQTIALLHSEAVAAAMTGALEPGALLSLLFGHSGSRMCADEPRFANTDTSAVRSDGPSREDGGALPNRELPNHEQPNHTKSGFANTGKQQQACLICDPSAAKDRVKPWCALMLAFKPSPL